MKKFLQRSLMWLVALVAMFAVSGNAWAQDAVINTAAGQTSNGGATISGGYGYDEGCYLCAPSQSIVISATRTITKIVMTNNSNYRSYTSDNWVASPNSCSTSGLITTWEGEATSITFNNPLPNRWDYLGVDKVEVWYAEGGEVDPGTGGGEVDPDPEQPGGEELNVTFNFSKGFVAEQDGITCESDGQANPVYGWQVKNGKHITFAAPYGYLISKIVLSESYSNSAFYFSEIDGEDTWASGNTWTGTASSSVTLTAYYDSRVTTATITLVKDPNAKAIFADFTSAFPEDGSKVEELGSIVLGLPAGVTLSPTSGACTIIVNGEEQASKYSQSESGDLEVAVPYINEDGEYTIVIPRGLATAADGSISPETTLHYTVASPWFTITESMLGPDPAKSITFTRDDNGNILDPFQSFNIRLSNGLTFGLADAAPFRFTRNGETINGNLTVGDYDQTTATINFASNAIRTPGEYTFRIPAEALTTTDGRKNKEFSWTYTVDQPKAPEFVGATPADGTTLNKSVKGEYKFQFTQPLQDVSILKASITFPDGESLPFNSWANAAPLYFPGQSVNFFTLTLGDNFEQYFADHLKQDGQLTFSFPATCVTSTEGVMNAEEFSVSYNYVAPTFYTYEVVIEGLGENPNAVVSVKNNQYRHHEYVTVAETLLTETDVTYYQLDAYRATLTIRQPADGKIGAIIVSYTERGTAQVDRISPEEGTISLDDNEYGLHYFTIYMNGTWEQNAENVAGITITDATGATLDINPVSLWKGSDQINVSLTESLTTPGTYTLHIPAGLNTLTYGVDTDLMNPEMTFSWTITAATHFEFGYYDIVALPEDGKSLTGFKLYLPDGVQYGSIAKQTISLVTYDEETYEASETPVTARFTYNQADRCIDVTFSKAYTEKGSYSFAIPEDAFVAADGRTSKEVRLSGYVDPTEYISFVATPEGDKTITGPVAGITLTFPAGTTLTGANFDLTKVNVFGSTTFTLLQPTVANNVVTIPFAEPLNEGYFNYIISDGFATLANGAVSTGATGFNINVEMPEIGAEGEYVIFTTAGTQADIAYTSTTSYNIYGAPTSFSNTWGKINLSSLRHMTRVEITVSADPETIVEASNPESPLTVKNGKAIWTGSAKDLTFSSTSDIYVTEVKVYYDPNEEIVKDCSVGIDHLANNCQTGDCEGIPSNITLYMGAAAAATSWTGSDNCPEEVIFIGPDNKSVRIAQFNYWEGSDQIGIVLDKSITTPGNYQLIIPKGLVAFKGGKFNMEISLNWTILTPGDFDKDGIYELDDLTKLVNIVLQKEERVPGANVDGDDRNSVTISDVTTLIQLMNDQAAE